jgi:predicted ATPase
MEEDNKELHLNSLEIQNFRPFQRLKIERLGRVNLIVGKNSVGKSSVLEAINIYADSGSLVRLRQVLGEHDELDNKNSRNGWGNTINSQKATVKNLFFGRELDSPSISIGEIGPTKKRINIELGTYSLEETEDSIRLRLLSIDEIQTAENPRLAFSIQNGGDQSRISLLNRVGEFGIQSDLSSIDGVFVNTSGLHETIIGDLWKAIALTDAEEDVVRALRIIYPDVERVTVLTYDASEPEHKVIVKLKGSNERLPIRSLGDGMRRVFGIVLALVNSANGFLLIDEIENGLHYSVQLEVWKLIFEVARRLNVQVFATTHNWDCIQAFQKAAAADQQSESMLIRLENKAGRVVTTSFDKRKLTIVTQNDIEVR